MASTPTIDEAMRAVGEAAKKVWREMDRVGLAQVAVADLSVRRLTPGVGLQATRPANADGARPPEDVVYQFSRGDADWRVDRTAPDSTRWTASKAAGDGIAIHPSRDIEAAERFLDDIPALLELIESREVELTGIVERAHTLVEHL